MHARNTTTSLLAVLGLALSPVVTQAQSQLTLDWSLVDGIAGVSQNGEVAVVGTISPEDSGFMANGTVSFHSVFQPWPGFIFQPPLDSPSLQISLATNHVVIRWSTAYPSLQLEGASALTGATNNWAGVNITPVNVDATWQVIVPTTNAARFFRLRLN